MLSPLCILHLTKSTHWSLEAFLLMRPLFFPFSIIFLNVPPHMHAMTFHLHFLLFSIICIIKCVKMSFFLSKSFAIACANFISHNNQNEHPLGFFCPSFSLEYMSHQPWSYKALYGVLTKDVTQPSPLGEHHPRCSIITITTKMLLEKHTVDGAL